jgi:SAM-dependent methyltransferase
MSLCSKIHHHLHCAINEIIGSFDLRDACLLDVGCWDGVECQSYGVSLKTQRLLGVEIFEAQAREAEARGIEVARVNLEQDKLPWADATMDVVVCNQVFEHLKDIFLPLDEIARVLKPGGRLVISVPNLASLHNRVMLVAGRQPTSIRIFGPHVRGFAKGEFEAFLLTGGLFTCEQVRGVGFHPLPPALGGNLMGNVWRGACHTPIWVLQRTSGREFSFVQAYRGRSEQTLM